MQIHLSITSAVLLGLAALSGTANAVCADGEVGVGLAQLCGAAGPNQPQCGALQGSVFSNNCGIISLTQKSNYCDGNFKSGSSVRCNGNRDVTDVYTPGGNFGWCYRVNQRCDFSLGISSRYGGVDWCCKRV